MGLKKLIKNLQHHLAKGEHKDSVSCDQIDELLGRLEKKENKLQRKLAKEKDSAKRKHLKLQIKIASVQRKKGLARRRELEEKCK